MYYINEQMSYMIKSLRQANVQKTVDQIGELFNSDQFKGKVPHKEIRAMLNSKSWRRFAGGRGNLVSAWKEFCDPEMGFVRKGTQNWNYVHSRTGNELKEKKYEKIKDYDKNLSKILKMRGEDKVKNLIGFFTRGKGEISIDGKNLSVKGIGTRDQHLIQLHLTKGTGFRKKNVTFESINEELQNSQGEQTDFKKGDVVKDINPDCPHVGSEGEVTKVGNGTITFKVTNNGKNYQEGDELEKTVDQMVKLKESVNEDRDWDLARAGNVAKLADNIIKKMKIVKALHLKGKNKEAKVVLNNKVYSDLDYIGRAFSIIDSRPSESIGESRLNENDQSWAKYYSWRNDKSMTPKQKIGMSMREVRDSLQELEKIVFRSIKLKKELKVGSDNYWKSTHSALRRIHERLVKLTGKIANLY